MILKHDELLACMHACEHACSGAMHGRHEAALPVRAALLECSWHMCMGRWSHDDGVMLIRR
jgi:hypothetical protein